jgi:hypothetical protein
LQKYFFCHCEITGFGVSKRHPEDSDLGQLKEITFIIQKRITQDKEAGFMELTFNEKDSIYFSLNYKYVINENQH